MAELNYTVFDQTLNAVNDALESASIPSLRTYLGMSQIGEPCERKLFYDFRKCAKRKLTASGIKSIEDGFAQEAVMAKRLRMLPEINLITEYEGKQIAFSQTDGFFRGHADGIIKGLLERPEIWHIWEHKSVNETKFNQLAKLRIEKGEKSTLAEWDEIYYAQAQIYMHCAKLTRHYLTVSTPGGRDFISVRTAINEKAVNSILQKSHSIIYANCIPAKISDKPEFYKCKMCEFSEICSSAKLPDENCRTCKFIKIENGKQFCINENISIANNMIELKNLQSCKRYELNEIFAHVQIAKKQKPKTEKKSYAWSKKQIGS